MPLQAMISHVRVRRRRALEPSPGTTPLSVMKFHLPASLLPVACLLVASCYPYPEVPPHSQAGPRTSRQSPPTTSSPDQQRIKEEREKLAAAEQKKKDAERKASASTTPPATKPSTPASTTPTPPKPAEPKPRTDWPYATPVPGRAGLVFSPYNQLIVDVTDMPTGSLVSDPTFPPDQKKYFRVP